MIPSAPARVAALLAGDVQMIEGVPTADIANLKKESGSPFHPRCRTGSFICTWIRAATRTRRSSPSADGKPLDANPCATRACGRQSSKMIDRDAIVSRIMEGQGVAAGQLLPEQFFGTSKTLKPDKYDPTAAKKLLADAGYPNGFGLTLHTPNNRYINDAAVAQAVAQFLSRNGIPTKLETMPSNVFFSRGSKLSFRSC